MLLSAKRLSHKKAIFLWLAVFIFDQQYTQCLQIKGYCKHYNLLSSITKCFHHKSLTDILQTHKVGLNKLMSFPLVFKPLGNWILHYTKCIYSKHLHAFSMYLFCVEHLNWLLSLTERDTSWHLFGDWFKGKIFQLYSSHRRRRPHKPHQRSAVSGIQSSCAVALSLTSMERGLDRVPGFHRLPVIENTSGIMSPRCLWCVKTMPCLDELASSGTYPTTTPCAWRMFPLCVRKKKTQEHVLWLGFDSPMNHRIILPIKRCNLVQNDKKNVAVMFMISDSISCLSKIWL